MEHMQHIVLVLSMVILVCCGAATSMAELIDDSDTKPLWGLNDEPLVPSLSQLMATAIQPAIPRDDYLRRQTRLAAEPESVLEHMIQVERRSARRSADDSQCRNVCQLCRIVLSARWAALCYVQCHLGGREYDACLTVWSYRDDFFKLDFWN